MLGRFPPVLVRFMWPYPVREQEPVHHQQPVFGHGLTYRQNLISIGMQTAISSSIRFRRGPLATCPLTSGPVVLREGHVPRVTHAEQVTVSVRPRRPLRR